MSSFTQGSLIQLCAPRVTLDVSHQWVQNVHISFNLIFSTRHSIQWHSEERRRLRCKNCTNSPFEPHKVINYRNTGGRWSGFARHNHFAVRWTGRLRIFRRGHYYLSIISDDGSKLWIDNRYTINNDGLHGWRNRQTRRHLHAGWRLVRLEMFERGGHAGMLFRYHGPDTGNRWAVVRASGTRKVAHRPTYRHGVFMENAFYFGQGGRCQNLNGRRPNMARWRQVMGLASVCFELVISVGYYQKT